LRIGTEVGATGYKVTVKGKVMCEELKVQLQANWPDYVFAKGYELITLSELEKSIRENHATEERTAQEQYEQKVFLQQMAMKYVKARRTDDEALAIFEKLVVRFVKKIDIRFCKKNDKCDENIKESMKNLRKL